MIGVKLIINLKVNLYAIAIQVKVIIGVEVKLIVVTSIELISELYLIIE